MMKISTLVSFILFVALSNISCSTQDEEQSALDNNAAGTTIKGAVRAIENGKDGYTAQIQTKSNDLYHALVSIVNLGGPENFTQFKVGDKVVISGVPWMLGTEKQLKVDKIINVETTRTELLISETSFRGISVGDKISTHSDYSQKEVMATGEGDFEIYRIKDFNNNPIGYFLPDPNNESLVGDITVETQMAKTAEDINVGSSFSALKAKLPAVEVHGSEIEGRTYASYRTLSYRLDTAIFTYNVDMRKIPADTKITEIIINRKPLS